MPQDKLRLIYQNENFDSELLNRAVRLASDRQHSNASRLFKDLVDQGESIANCYLGMIYEYGDADVPANFEYARFYYEGAIEDGWVPGYIGLGRIYYYGLGVEQDLQRAHSYFDRIHKANVASPIADYYLGQMYLLGEGVERSLDRAKFFFERSSRAGYLWARSRLVKIAFEERRYFVWLCSRVSLLFATISIATSKGLNTWHTGLPTSTMGPSSLTFG